MNVSIIREKYTSMDNIRIYLHANCIMTYRTMKIFKEKILNAIKYLFYTFIM